MYICIRINNETGLEMKTIINYNTRIGDILIKKEVVDNFYNFLDNKKCNKIKMFIDLESIHLTDYGVVCIEIVKNNFKINIDFGCDSFGFFSEYDNKLCNLVEESNNKDLIFEEFYKLNNLL